MRRYESRLGSSVYAFIEHALKVSWCDAQTPLFQPDLLFLVSEGTHAGTALTSCWRRTDFLKSGMVAGAWLIIQPRRQTCDLSLPGCWMPSGWKHLLGEGRGAEPPAACPASVAEATQPIPLPLSGVIILPHPPARGAACARGACSPPWLPRRRCPRPCPPRRRGRAPRARRGRT